MIWDPPSVNSRGSMLIGNGDIGANVWGELSGARFTLKTASNEMLELKPE